MGRKLSHCSVALRLLLLTLMTYRKNGAKWQCNRMQLQLLMEPSVCVTYRFDGFNSKNGAVGNVEDSVPLSH